MGTRTGYASLPLHGGKAPAWLFSRMVLLSRKILAHIVEEYGTRGVLRRLSDPFWFQAFGCVLGFDWHSSGVTTTVCGAVKESLRETGTEWGLLPQGGKARRPGKPSSNRGCLRASGARSRHACPCEPDGRAELARFAFAHGGKDGIPFPVDRPAYDKTIDILNRALDKAHVDRSERVKALRRLAAFRP